VSTARHEPSTVLSAPDFVLPPELEAIAPPASRSGVRLLVATPYGSTHSGFGHFADFLLPGDLLVVNTSATLAAAVDGQRGDARPVTVHFSTELGAGEWVIELRPASTATGPVTDARAGEHVQLAGGGDVTLLDAYPAGQRPVRLWRAAVAVDEVPAYLAVHGRAIRYSYVRQDYPMTDYQTVFARDPGSAEMPSAGRPFTTDIVLDLVTRGIAVAPITLHTGVSSQQVGEPPLPERYAVPIGTARLVNSARAAGGRIVAVGTTVTRALETVADADGLVRAGRGWTDLVLGPERPARVVNGLVTGWHEPGASHLRLLQAVAGGELLARAYREALTERYLWHEFGDSCLLLP
jgi:S-adenosylmethionine:tRNA ribosyltransferase-isomerase